VGEAGWKWEGSMRWGRDSRRGNRARGGQGWKVSLPPVTCPTLSLCCPDPGRECVEGVIDAEGLEAKVLVSIKQVPSSHIPAHTYPSCPLSATGEFRGFCCTHFDSAHAECQSNDLFMTSSATNPLHHSSTHYTVKHK